MDLAQAPQQLDAFAAMAWTWAVEFLPRLAMAVVIVSIGVFVSRWAARLVTGVATGTGRVDETVRPVLAAVVRYAIMILVLIAALGQIGVQTASLLAVLGAAGLAIGLALQGTLANISAGIMLLWLRPFRVGDYIEVAGAGNIAGTVKEIGLFVCIIETFEGIMLFAPNSAIWNTAIRNHTRNGGRLVSFTVTLPANADVARARAALADMASSSHHVLRNPPPEVFLDTLSGANVQLTCRLWVSSAGLGKVQRALITEANRRLRAMGEDAVRPEQIVRTVPPDSDPSRLLGAGAEF